MSRPYSKHKHFPYHLHMCRAILAALALVAIAVPYAPSLSLPVRQGIPAAQGAASPPQVLAYATNINRADLAAYANAARTSSGLGTLSQNNALDAAAQMKANDMIANNYWAHVSPSGVQPWYWFTAAGYDYTAAGENLAYGFATSENVITAWMNSAGHRANLLGSYQEVGYGIASGENYQGSQNTVVVAHYGTPRATPPAAPVTPAAPAAPAPPAPIPSSAAPAEPPAAPAAPAVTPAQTPAPVQTANDTPAKAVSPATSPSVTVPATTTGIPVWQQLLSGQAPLMVLISVSLLTIVAAGYLATHISLVKYTARIGEQYVLHHPFIDAGIAVTASIIVLLTTIARIG